MQSNIRIVDIARMANVSAGTVDRVLHNRGQVSAEKREKVERVLQEMNYHPNMVARFLASKKSFTIRLIIPAFKAGDYWELVSKGIEQAIGELSDFKISVDYSFYNQDNEDSFIRAIAEMKASEFDALIVSTHFIEPVVSVSSYLDSLSIPYIYIDTEVAGQHNMSYFGANTYQSGAIAAKLLLLEIGIAGDIIITNVKSGNAISHQQSSRKKGFLDYLEQHHFQGTVRYFDLDRDRVEENVTSFRSLLTGKGQNTGAVVFNSRVHELVRLNEICRSEIKIIGYAPTSSATGAISFRKAIRFFLNCSSLIPSYRFNCA